MQRKIETEFGAVSTNLDVLFERTQYLHQSDDECETSNNLDVNENDDVIGIHQGLVFYTLGQRQGLGIGGLKDSKDSPWYVANKNLKENILVAVQGNNHPLLLSKELDTINLSLVSTLEEKEFYGKAKVRYRQEDQDCLIQITNKKLIILVHKLRK